MMSTRDFEHKQIAFVFTTDGEKISFKNDNLIVTDKDGKIKHQSTCYRLFALFICDVIAAAITVGLNLFPTLFCTIRTGLTPPCSEPTTGLRSA